MCTVTMGVTCRNLTEIFILMRNNSLQNKHVLSDQSMDDEVALVSSKDFERCNNFTQSQDLPPVWVEGIEDIQYEMSRIRQKLQELSSLYEKHLTRPSLDDAVQEENVIETVVQDITRMFLHCKKIIYQIKDRARGSNYQDNQISKNVLASLVSSLQDLSSSFHNAQSSHLKKLQCREEKSHNYFNSSCITQCDDYLNFDSFQDEDYNQFFNHLGKKQKQVLIENNVIMVEQREREIKQIIQSLAELNEIFQDLASMVADQGTVLDRIDFNLEKVQTEVHSGLTHLQKAERYHQKNRKMFCIILLATTIIIAVIILIIFKT